MARVTVEDCLKNVKNRFELVIVAAKRARQLMRGKEPKVDWDNDKPTVVALREIAAGFTNVDNVNSTEGHTDVPELSLLTQALDEKPEASSPEDSISADPSAPTEEQN